MTNPLHTIVGFFADFPVTQQAVEPAGKELATFFYQELLKAGFVASAPEDYEGWAWDICTSDGAAHVTTRVGLVDDMDTAPPRQWLVTNEGSTMRPLLKRLFGGDNFNKALADEKQEMLLRRVCETLHTVTKRESRFSHLTWYNERTFDKPGDVPNDKP
ncbi:MAG: hypothetical protein JWM68_643 [Verrucomicrobiales bacterium]|nr:hypothetical protein [Verrucomicrobiales bacterium]